MKKVVTLFFGIGLIACFSVNAGTLSPNKTNRQDRNKKEIRQATSQNGSVKGGGQGGSQQDTTVVKANTPVVPKRKNTLHQNKTIKLQKN